MKIWIHLNGLQQGPYDLSQLSQLPINGQTPVWYEGLTQWTAAAVAPATASLFAASQQPTQTADDAQTSSSQQPPVPPQPSSMPPYPGVQQVFMMTPPPKRPATYLWLAILLTVLCCSPVALVAIITGCISSSQFNSGNYNAAQTMSEVTQWLLIIAIVVSIFSVPFGFGLLM